MEMTDTPRIEFAPGMKMHHASRAKAEKLAAMFLGEYPKLTLEAVVDDETDKVVGYEVHHSDHDEGPIYEDVKLPSLAEILDTCADLDLNPEADEEEEEEPKVSGSVVPEHYRKQYQLASSNGQTCGDWLAETLVSWTNNGKGFNVADFDAILNANDVDMTRPWAKLPTSGQPGWIGRYRMNGRQVLEKSVAHWGFLRDAFGTAHFAPDAFLNDLRTKHAKWLAKMAKLEADALATAGKKEGEAA